MKKLTAADMELLKARGKVTSLTTSTEFSIPSYKKVNKVRKSKKAVNPNSNHPLVGKMVHTSWGYNMTINNFAKILEVSPTGKTVVCRMLNKEGFNGFTGKVKAGNTLHGEKFRLKVSECMGKPSFHGSYPYSSYGNSKRMGYFSLYNGEEVYENHMD